jgi:hypothetical protein
LRIQRFIAVPRFQRKAVKVLRDSDLISRVELTALDEHAFALAKIDRIFLDALRPRVLMPVGKEEEESLHLDTPAHGKQFLQASRIQAREPFKQFVDLMEAFPLR